MINIEVDAREVARWLTGFEEQIPFATMVGLNRTGDDANAEIRQEYPKHFTVRWNPMVRFLAPLRLDRASRATKANLSVLLKTEGSGRMLDPYEAGLPHEQKSPDVPVAVPTDNLRFTKQTVVPRLWYPHNLGLTPYRDPKGNTFYALGRGAKKNKLTPFKTTARGVVQIKGKRRTFVLDPSQHRGLKPSQWGIYIRIGPKRGDIRLLWMYRRSVRRPAALRFFETVQATVDRRWVVNMTGAIELAIRTARVRV